MDVHNRPRHECSSTLISTHPLQFQLSNRTSNSAAPTQRRRFLANTPVCVQVVSTYKQRYRKTTLNEQTCKKKQKRSLICSLHLRHAAAASTVNSAPVGKMAVIKFTLPRLCGCKYDKVFKSQRLTLLSIHQSLLASPSEAVGVCRQS